MGSYRARLDRLEELISPSPPRREHVIVIEGGRTEEQAIESYAAERGIAVSEVRAGELLIVTIGE